MRCRIEGGSVISQGATELDFFAYNVVTFRGRAGKPLMPASLEGEWVGKGVWKFVTTASLGGGREGNLQRHNLMYRGIKVEGQHVELPLEGK